ncbi:MAG: M48 family metallopeptidase [Planctomycetes bacterium]|nr:M48 family metallopeptidase [Planctomycetota bacterium]
MKGAKAKPATATSVADPSERAVATYGTRTIPYRIERGRRRLTVAIVVDPTAGVILRAPRHVEPARLAQLVRRKGAWIVERLRSFEDLLPAPAPREFVSGESFHYLGRQHRLRVESARELARATVALREGRLHVTVPTSIPAADRARAVRDALKLWYRRRAALYLPPRLAHWAEKLGVAVPPLLIREPAKRWGSCDARGNVRINWRVMQVAPRLIDYVLAHELVHLEHRLHDAEFWARLGTVMGDAEGRRQQLRTRGAVSLW